jgi:hypothetical protein
MQRRRIAIIQKLKDAPVLVHKQISEKLIRNTHRLHIRRLLLAYSDARPRNRLP